MSMKSERAYESTAQVQPVQIQPSSTEQQNSIPIVQQQQQQQQPIPIPIQLQHQPIQQTSIPATQTPKSIDMDEVLRNITLQNFQLQQMLLQNTLLSQVQKQQEIIKQEPVKEESSVKRNLVTESTQTEEMSYQPQQATYQPIYRPAIPQILQYNPYEPPRKLLRSLAYKRLKKAIWAVLFASILGRRLSRRKLLKFQPSPSSLSKCDTALVLVYKSNLALHSAFTEIAQMTRQGGYFTSDSILSDLTSVFSKSWIPTLRKVLFHLVSSIEQIAWDDIKNIRVLYETCKSIVGGQVSYNSYAGASVNDSIRASLLYCIVLRPLVLRMLCTPVECGLVTKCNEALGKNLRTISAYLFWIICKAVGGNATGGFIEFDRAVINLVPGDIGADLFDKNGMKGLKSLPKGVVDDAVQRLVSWAAVLRQEIETS